MGKIMPQQRDSVKTFKSQIDIGGVVTPCLAVVIEPHPDTQEELEAVGFEIQAAVKEMYRR